MGSSLDIIGSYVIGGIVIISLTAVMLNLQGETSDTVMNELAQTTVADIGQQMERDLNRIGYRVSGGQKILRLTSTSIRFLTDLDNDGVVDTVEYFMSKSTQGIQLMRSQGTPGQQSIQWSMGAAVVEFTGTDSLGNTVSDIAAVRAVTMQLATVNPTKEVKQLNIQKQMQECGSEVGAYWHKRVLPPNL
jgi:hypothetical protein